jgi:putative Ca2+/H+ antiporter (TMEM165/GDT1 family)
MIDWNLLGLSFITVFLAELGDKSHFAAIALSGSAKSAKAVFFGSVTALILASLIGVLIGEGTAQILPTRITKLFAAIGFAAMAIKLLFFGEAEAETETIAIVADEMPTDS